MQPRFHSAFAQLPLSLQSALKPILDNDHFAACLSAKEVNRICADCGMDAETLTLSLLPLAAACALTPISAFHVGAIAQGSSGNLYFGANIELATMPLQQTMHAEQSAVTHAWMRNESKLRALMVNYTPCGHCRQFMAELNSAPALKICLPNRQTAPLSHYLPDAFGPQDLSISTLLMDTVDHGLTLAETDPLTVAALVAANRSHAPYSQAFSGVALESITGTVYAGSYAENAAFNPSLPPLQTALNMMNLSGEALTDIKRAVLVERKNSLLSQWSITHSILSTLGCSDIRQQLIN
ncbi:cytidine deaminase [Pectobacteriaceae bacterium CE90]|nr:cytidine deaminase [Prodigiosinella sp. LS101]WJV52217.1 cytidine deaminase [Prodigiosinella sp. LS101]WJV56573.1 cytidine deaminase [Pectobacteriaceae bacterium C111]WJY16601.1 cytidine deaminase [Pectobacteriaceae bacterium CE90]